MPDLLSCIIIGIVIVIVGTAIYIGRLLYKGRRKNDLENGGKIQKRKLEPEPLPEETKEVTQKTLQSLAITSKDSQSSLENSSITLLPQEKERKSPSPKINSRKNSKSHSKTVKSNPRSYQLSRNDSMNGSKNGSRNSSRYNSMNGSRKSSTNGSRKGSTNGSRKVSTNGSRRSRNDFRINSLVIDIPNDIPPPPPPSPLKVRESYLNMIPSDISDSTYIAQMSSNASSPIRLSRAQSKSELKAQPTIQVECPV